MGPSGTPRSKCVCFPWAAAEKLICIRRDKCYTHTWTVKNWQVFFFVQSLVGAVEWMLWSSAVTRRFVLQRRWQTEEGSPRQQQLELTCVHMCTHTHTRYVCIENMYLLSTWTNQVFTLDHIFLKVPNSTSLTSQSQSRQWNFPSLPSMMSQRARTPLTS